MKHTPDIPANSTRRFRPMPASPSHGQDAAAHRRSSWLGALAASALVIGALTGCAGVAGPALPSGFPTSEVPVAAGDMRASSGSANQWTYAVGVKDAAAQEAALQKLRDAGYIVIAKSGDVYTLTGPRFKITLTKSTSKDGALQVKYQVSPRPGAPTTAPTPAPTPTSTKN